MPQIRNSVYHLHKLIDLAAAQIVVNEVNRTRGGMKMTECGCDWQVCRHDTSEYLNSSYRCIKYTNQKQ